MTQSASWTSIFLTTLTNAVAGSLPNVLEGNLTDQKSTSAPLNALRLHAQIRSLESSGVAILPPTNTGKDSVNTATTPAATAEAMAVTQVSGL